MCTGALRMAGARDGFHTRLPRASRARTNIETEFSVAWGAFQRVGPNAGRPLANRLPRWVHLAAEECQPNQKPGIISHRA